MLIARVHNEKGYVLLYAYILYIYMIICTVLNETYYNDSHEKQGAIITCEIAFDKWGEVNKILQYRKSQENNISA